MRIWPKVRRTKHYRQGNFCKSKYSTGKNKTSSSSWYHSDIDGYYVTMLCFKNDELYKVKLYAILILCALQPDETQTKQILL